MTGRFTTWFCLGVCLWTGYGCATKPVMRRQSGESVVFVGQEPAALAHAILPGQPLEVRGSYLAGDAPNYAEGRDFTVDFSAGTLTRTADSRLPDFQTNILFGHEQFDHSRFPGYGNLKFFAFVDYAYTTSNRWPVQAPQLEFLQGAAAKLRAGQPLKIVAFGDSITAGGEATKPELVFWRRWADALQREYPRARVTAINGATGGDTTVQGLERLEAKVIAEKPDLVLIGFGMNDNNRGSVPVPNFEQNLRTMVARIRAANGAEVILFSAFPPNPKWKFGSEHMADYAAATRQAARNISCAYADVFDNWEAVAARRKPEDMLGNNINHPNDFGHWIYYRVLSELGLDRPAP